MRSWRSLMHYGSDSMSIHITLTHICNSWMSIPCPHSQSPADGHVGCYQCFGITFNAQIKKSHAYVLV